MIMVPIVCRGAGAGAVRGQLPKREKGSRRRRRLRMTGSGIDPSSPPFISIHSIPSSSW
jgi:hypothetical protein